MKKSFFFHYNKPASSKLGKPQITLHYNQTCYILDNVVCKVPVSGRIRKTQPRWVMAGKGEVVIENSVAFIK